MPRAVDRRPLPITNNPTESIEVHIRQGLIEGAELWNTILEAIREHAEGLVREVMQKLMGLPAVVDQALDELFALLPDWMPELPDLGELYETLTGIVGATVTDAQQWAEGIRNALHGINLSEPGSILALLGSIFGLNGGSVTLQSVVEAATQRLFGMIDLRRLGVIPASHIGEDNPELLANPGFTDAVAIRLNTEWEHDDTVGRSAPFGTAKTTADGNDRILLSEPIAVVAGHKIDFSTWWKWVGLTYTGSSPLVMGVRTYWRDPETMAVTEVDDVDLASATAPPANSSNAPEADFVQLVAPTWIVPSSGVNEVCLRLSVLDNATAGDVWVDDASAKKPGVIPQNLVTGLVSSLGSINSQISGILSDLAEKLGLDALADLIDSIGGGVGSTLADIQTRLANLSVNGLLDASALTNIANIPAIAQSKITGLGTALGNLASDIADRLEIDNWNAWLSGAWNNALSDIADKLNVSDWDDWLSAQWQSLLDGAKGSAGGAIGDILDRIQKLRTDGQLAAGDIFGQLAQTQVTGLVQLVSDLINNPSAVIGTLTQGMVSGLTGALGNLNSAIGQIGDIFDGQAVTPISTAVGNVLGWFNNLLGWQDDTETTQVTLANKQNVITDFQVTTLATQLYRNPPWISRYAIADVSYPEILNMRSRMYGSATWNTESTYFVEISVLGMPVNSAIGSYVVTSVPCVYDTLMVACNHLGTASNNMRVEVFQVAPGRTSATRVFTAPLTGLTTDTSIIEVNIPEGIPAAVGDTWLVRLVNVGTNGQTLGFARMRANKLAFAVHSFVTTDSGSTNKTSYTAGELAAGVDVSTPWVGLAMKAGTVADATYADDFWAGYLQTLWNKSSSTANHMSVANRKVSYGGTTNGHQTAVYSLRTGYNRHQAEVTVSDASSNADARSGPMVACSRDMSQIVFAGVNANSVNLYTGSAASPTQRASAAVGGNGRWVIRYAPTANAYRVYKDGVQVLSWTDSGNVTQHGTDFRFGGMRIVRAGGSNGGLLAEFVVRDCPDE